MGSSVSVDREVAKASAHRHALLKRAKFEWAPIYGRPAAQGMMIISLLHSLLGAIRGLVRVAGQGSVEELWEIVKERGDKLLADATSDTELDMLVAPDA